LNLTDALVDTGATTLALPSRLIRQLGLSKVREQRAISFRGPAVVNIYEVVRLTILNRICSVEVMEVPDEVPALIGQIPLEMLDLVIDLQGRRLTGNPAHGGEHTLELF
jgi:predicted aspartyl protease